MLTFAFFISAFVSSCWFIYAIMYINERLGDASFSSLPLPESSAYIALILVPILIMWMIFGYVHQFFSTKFINRKTFKLLQQMKKNQDYTDLMVRIMIDAEHEIKDGFILNKFDIFISDMNEMLADLLIRCNLVSSGQLESLWNKVLHGERWSIAKILISNSPAGYSVSEKIFEYAKRDQVIAGTLMEFCARYQTLVSLMEKHDQDGIFLNIIQTGVMGKAYSILAPISQQIQYGTSEKNFELSNEKITNTVLEDSKDKAESKKSFISSMMGSLFHKKEVENEDLEDEEDEFFAALSSDNQEKREPSFSIPSEPQEDFSVATTDNDNDDTDKSSNNANEELSYPFGE